MLAFPDGANDKTRQTRIRRLTMVTCAVLAFSLFGCGSSKHSSSPPRPPVLRSISPTGEPACQFVVGSWVQYELGGPYSRTTLWLHTVGSNSPLRAPVIDIVNRYRDKAGTLKVSAAAQLSAIQLCSRLVAERVPSSTWDNVPLPPWSWIGPTGVPILIGTGSAS
jgi:hypothetical protein